MIVRAIAATAAGLTGSLAFAPVEWWPALLLSIALLVGVVSGSWRATLLEGWLFGLGFFLPLLHWSGTYVGWFPWVALAVLQAGMIAPVGPAVSWLKGRLRPGSAILAIAGVWVLVEAIRARIPWGGFGWGRTAFSQIDAPHHLVVTLGGAPLLSFTTVLIAAAIGLRSGRAFTIALVSVAAMVTISMRLLPEPSTTSLRVAVVQGNVPRLGLDFNAQRQAVLDNHIAATQEVEPDSADLVIWPENASDIDPLDDAVVRARLDRLAADVGAPILVGAVLREDGQLLNATIQWSKAGPEGRYVKRRLAPFGEYMPLRALAERIEPDARRVVDFTAGDQVALFPIGTQSVGSLICFEVLYDDLARDLVRAGATLLVAQTNSATFGTSPESHQQLQMTRLRAIEHQRAIASASTSGISALIDQGGRVLAESEFFTRDLLQGSLATSSALTLSSRFGGWAEALLISLPFMVLLRRRR